MRVIVPFTRLNPSTVYLLDRFAPGWDGIRMDPDRPGQYQDLMEAEWAAPGDFAVVEHDIGVHEGVVPGFLACPELWCAHEYNIAGQMLACLGCTRFRHGLKTAVPDLFTRIDTLPYDGAPPRDWRRMDVRLAGVLTSLGYAPHIHTPPVEHYHIYD